MTSVTVEDCDCQGCAQDDGCWWPQGETGRAPQTEVEPGPPEPGEPVS